MRRVAYVGSVVLFANYDHGDDSSNNKDNDDDNTSRNSSFGPMAKPTSCDIIHSNDKPMVYRGGLYKQSGTIHMVASTYEAGGGGDFIAF